MPIHPTAIVSKGANIDETADIGPFCVVGDNVTIGAHSQLVSHVTVQNRTTIGSDNIIFPFAAIGGIPQDLKYRGEPSRLVIGNHNVIREGATLNIGTEAGDMQTTVGDGCLLMCYSHVAHDCRLADNVILANSVALAGHVDIDESVTVGGVAAIHQRCRIGKRAFIGGGAMVAHDVPPFCLAVGDRAKLMGLNLVGLKRAGFSRECLRALRQSFELLFLSGMARDQALAVCERDLASAWPEVAELCTFLRDSKRGVSTAATNASVGDDVDNAA
jgi:UDP-N-acetylglucosamine acyltransferase